MLSMYLLSRSKKYFGLINNKYVCVIIYLLFGLKKILFYMEEFFMSEEIKNVSQIKNNDSLEKFIAYKKSKKIKISDVELEDIIKNKSITFTFESAISLIIEAGLENNKQNYFFKFDFSNLRDRFCVNVTSGKEILTSQNLTSFLMSYGDVIPGKDDDDDEKNKDKGRRIRFILIYMFSQSLDKKNLGYLSEDEHEAVCNRRNI